MSKARAFPLPAMFLPAAMVILTALLGGGCSRKETAKEAAKENDVAPKQAPSVESAPEEPPAALTERLAREKFTGDLDEFDPGDHPADLEILAHSPVSLSGAVSETGASQGFIYSDMTYWTDATSRAGIFDSGATSWIGSLTPCRRGTRDCPATITRRITGNLFALFGRGPAGRFRPSVPNWRQVYGPNA